jgi:hypothetical protein
MPKDYTVEDYSHPASEHEKHTGPVCLGVDDDGNPRYGDEDPKS